MNKHKLFIKKSFILTNCRENLLSLLLLASQRYLLMIYIFIRFVLKKNDLVFFNFKIISLNTNINNSIRILITR